MQFFYYGGTVGDSEVVHPNFFTPRATDLWLITHMNNNSAHLKKELIFLIVVFFLQCILQIVDMIIRYVFNSYRLIFLYAYLANIPLIHYNISLYNYKWIHSSFHSWDTDKVCYILCRWNLQDKLKTTAWFVYQRKAIILSFRYNNTKLTLLKSLLFLKW